MSISRRSSPTRSTRAGTRSASEVVRAALRLLEEREVQLSALQGALEAGEASGEAEAFDFDAFIASKTA